MGMLKPSTLEMSKKSRLLNWFRANSARVFGGLPHPVHCNTPPQSPVSHPPLPLSSKLQFVRPHIRAMAVPGGTLMFQLWPWSSRWPPPTGVAAAHTIGLRCTVQFCLTTLLSTVSIPPLVSASSGLRNSPTFRRPRPSPLSTTVAMSNHATVHRRRRSTGAAGVVSGLHGTLLVQQNSGFPNVGQALLHPPGTLRGPRHWPTISAVHETWWHLSGPGLVGPKLMGMLKPSMLEMSKKSRLLNWFRANSARVLGALPHPVHCNTPLQSPVSHEPLPLPSKLQFLRPHIRAMAVPRGTLMFQLWPLSRRWPPPTGVAAAQTV
nr:hypothetical protein C2845_PM04G30420 [Ipomoea batatas]